MDIKNWASWVAKDKPRMARVLCSTMLFYDQKIRKRGLVFDLMSSLLGFAAELC